MKPTWKHPNGSKFDLILVVNFTNIIDLDMVKLVSLIHVNIVMLKTKIKSFYQYAQGFLTKIYNLTSGWCYFHTFTML